MKVIQHTVLQVLRPVLLHLLFHLEPSKKCAFGFHYMYQLQPGKLKIIFVRCQSRKTDRYTIQQHLFRRSQNFVKILPRNRLTERRNVMMDFHHSY